MTRKIVNNLFYKHHRLHMILFFIAEPDDIPGIVFSFLKYLPDSCGSFSAKGKLRNEQPIPRTLIVNNGVNLLSVFLTSVFE